MYLNALEFLEEERDAWRPYEALANVPDDRLDIAVEGAHGWSARDLIGHLVAWQEYALATARELAVGERSATKERLDEEWDRRGDAINAGIEAEWRALPVEEVRRRLTTVPGELRGYLTVVPETRWIKNDEYLRYFLDETIEHYAEHAGDLEAVLAAAAADE
ncbi:MAG: ClbS/DfsB family four-helix bundle protein [Chloroflexota bacterium]|nr:MAG: ClbS/DfsB family four-helix bundle protein [Chloroflexota bacterium]